MQTMSQALQIYKHTALTSRPKAKIETTSVTPFLRWALSDE